MHQDLVNDSTIVPRADLNVFGELLTGEGFAISAPDLEHKKKMKPGEYIPMDITDERLLEGNR